MLWVELYIADTIACVSGTCKLVFNGPASKIDTFIFFFFYDQLTKSRIIGDHRTLMKLQYVMNNRMLDMPLVGCNITNFMPWNSACTKCL